MGRESSPAHPWPKSTTLVELGHRSGVGRRDVQRAQHRGHVQNKAVNRIMGRAEEWQLDCNF